MIRLPPRSLAHAVALLSLLGLPPIAPARLASAEPREADADAKPRSPASAEKIRAATEKRARRAQKRARSSRP